MATKNQVRLDYNPELVQGVAELDDKQVNNYQTTAQRLRSDLTYVVPKQWIHSEDVTVNGQKRKSNKIFAIGVDASGNAICVVTMSVNGLRARHYGKVKENPTLRISAVQNEDKLWRCAPGTAQEPVFAQGALPLTVTGKKAYINRNFAFNITGRHSCYGVNFTETAPNSGKYNIDRQTIDGADFVKLTSQTLNEYTEIDNVPTVDSTVIPGFDTYTNDLP